jgi:hypothetical protein
MIREAAPAPPKGYRPHMSVSVKLEAALRALGMEPRDVEWDHDPPLQLRVWCPVKGDTIPPANDPRFIVPRRTRDHAAKTANVDIPAIAKTRRLSSDHELFRARALAKAGGDPAPEPKRRSRRIPSRPFQKRGTPNA